MVELSPFAHRVQIVSGITAALLVLLALVIIPGILDKPLTTLQQIQKRGYLEVLTLNSATTYYQDIEGANGFEYHLAKWFAESIGVEAKFITISSFADLYPELLFGGGDIVAAGLSTSDSDFSRSVAYGPPYYEVSNQIMYRKTYAERPRKIADLADGSLKAISGTAQIKLLQELQKEHNDLVWIEANDIATEELIEQLGAGEVDYILADSHEIAMQRRYFPELRIAFELGKPRQIRWAFNHSEDGSLDTAITRFFQQIKEDGRLEQLVHRHYSQVAEFNYSDTQTFTQKIESQLPKYQTLFEKEAIATGLEWQILAAIGYQESHWREHARSPTGVRGLMMLTLTTAKQMKISNRLDAAQSIHGGAKYFASVLKRIPQRIPKPDRIWLALAAYNVGLGHVEDARKITTLRGGDPDRWIDVKKNLPLLARKKWYKDTKYGYARGWEPVKYVENIRQYYGYLIGLESKTIRDSSTSRPIVEVNSLAPSL
jgi:membrane-bound lytic murein transglycosylase F